MKWSFDGQDSFEDYVARIGGYACTLGVGEICFKNTLFQSFCPPCSFIVSDMEPSMSMYRKMSRKEYVQALHERLEPASACDLIYTQFKERIQKAGEVYNLYLILSYLILNIISLYGRSLLGKPGFLKNSVNPVLEDCTMKS